MSVDTKVLRECAYNCTKEEIAEITCDAADYIEQLERLVCSEVFAGPCGNGRFAVWICGDDGDLWGRVSTHDTQRAAIDAAIAHMKGGE